MGLSYQFLVLCALVSATYTLPDEGKWDYNLTTVINILKIMKFIK